MRSAALAVRTHVPPIQVAVQSSRFCADLVRINVHTPLVDCSKQHRGREVRTTRAQRRRNLHMSAYSLLTSVKCRHLAYSQWRREEVGGRAILYVFGMESGVVRSKLCLSVEDSCCIQYHSWRISVLGYFYVGSVRGEVSQTSTTLPLHL